MSAPARPSESPGRGGSEAPRPQVLFNVTRSGTGTGTVSCDGTACAPSYSAGTEVTLAATAAAGSTFAADPTPTPTSTPTPSPAPEPEEKGQARVSGSASVSDGKAALKAKNLVIATASFALSPGSTRTLAVKIANAQAKQLLAQGRTLKAQLVGTGVQGGR